jgi:cell division protein FtsL
MRRTKEEMEIWEKWFWAILIIASIVFSGFLLPFETTLPTLALIISTAFIALASYQFGKDQGKPELEIEIDYKNETINELREEVDYLDKEIKGFKDDK